MLDGELFAFMDTFRDLQRVFPKRLDEHEQARIGGDYFKALRRFPLRQVQDGAEVWIQRGKYFPKPAEWIDAIPRPGAVVRDVPTLSEADARDYQHAERLGYEGPTCRCGECIAAGVTEKPLRFVPEISADGRDRLVRIGERTVTAGHWAHGQELARWYQARADFWNRCHELGLTSIAKELARAGR
jgi:hypothetical protein